MLLNKLGKHRSSIQMFFGLMWIGIVIFCITSVFVISVERNTFSSDYSYFTKKSLNLLLPQGWGFFTKKPTLEKIKVYRLTDNKLVLANKPNASGENYFGLSRKYRRYNFEYGQLSQYIPKSHWQPGKNMVLSRIHYNNALKMRIDRRFPNLGSGRYIIIKYKDIPWAWADEVAEPELLSYALIELFQ